MKLRMGVIVIACVALAAGNASAYAIRGYAISNGGTGAAGSSNGTHRVRGTAGLPAVATPQGSGEQVCSGFWCFGGTRVLDIDPAPNGAAPIEFSLGPPMPNPASDRARFDLALPRSAVVTLSVFDVTGRRVGEPVSRRFEAGAHELTWRAAGAEAGIYFVRVATDGVVRAQRTLVLVK